MNILVCGTDTFRSREKLKELREHFIKKHDEARLNVLEIDAEDAGIEKISQAVQSSPFLSSARLVILKNLAKSKLNENVTQKIFLNTPSNNIIIFFEGDGFEDIEKIFKGFVFKAKYEFNLMSGNETKKWATAYAKSKGADLEQGAAETLVEFFGADSGQLAREIHKLKNLGNKVIKKDDVISHAAGSREINIFDLVERLTSGNPELALSLMRGRIFSDDEALRVFQLVARQIKLLLQVKSMSTNKNLKLPNFVFNKLTKQRELWSEAKLKQAYEKILETDKKLKTGFIKPQNLPLLLISLSNQVSS